MYKLIFIGFSKNNNNHHQCHRLIYAPDTHEIFSVWIRLVLTDALGWKNARLSHGLPVDIVINFKCTQLFIEFLIDIFIIMRIQYAIGW